MSLKRNLYIFIGTWVLLMASVPLYNVVTQGPADTIQLAMSKGRLSKSGLKNAIFNLDQTSKLLANIVQPHGISTDPNSVVVGRSGWLYLGDRYASTLTAMREGMTQNDVERANAVSEAMLEWNRWLGLRGVHAFRILVGPNKHSVHPEGLPNWAAARHPAKIQSLTTGSAGELYVEISEKLRNVANQSTESLYFKTDTHWNALGAAKALRLFAENSHLRDLGIQWPKDSDFHLARVDSRSGGDLAKFLRLTDSMTDREPVIEMSLLTQSKSKLFDFDTNEVLQKGRGNNVNYPFQTVLVKSPIALNHLKVLWIRDSFGAALSPYMAATFSEVVQLHQDRAFENEGQRLVQIVDQWHPDLVFITVVERSVLSEVFTTRPPSK